MAFPWVTIIMWVISFFLSKNKGMSNGKAALSATGMAAATYVVADPSNKDNLIGWGQDTNSGDASLDGAATASTKVDDDYGSLDLSNLATDEEANATLSEDPTATETASGKIIMPTQRHNSAATDMNSETSNTLAEAVKATGGVASTVVSTAGDVAKSFGPAGTVGVIAGTGAAKKVADSSAESFSGFMHEHGKTLLWIGVGLVALTALK